MDKEISEADVPRLKRQVRELMAQDRQKLLMRFPFTGGIAMRLDLVPVHDCRLETCSTDFERIYADIGFYARLSECERLHVLAHEIWHCVLMHGMRRQSRDPRRFNVAADLEIYFLLNAEGMGIPFHLPYMQEWEDERLSAEEIYDRLPVLRRAIDSRGKYRKGAESKNIKASGDGQGFDKHAELDEGRDVNRGKASATGGKKPYFDEDYLPGWRISAAESMREKIVAAAQQVERMRGILPGCVKAIVEAALKPEIRWQELLAQFVTSCYGGSRRWLPPNRRYVSQGLYLQSTRKERLRAVVAVDTSGSTTHDLPRFFTELNSLLKTFGSYELTVIQADAEVQSVDRFDDAAPCGGNGEWESRGHGGTDFRPVFDYVEEHFEIDPSCLIYVTDGLGPAPAHAPSYPVMWLLTYDGTQPAAWGHAVKFRSE